MIITRNDNNKGWGEGGLRGCDDRGAAGAMAGAGPAVIGCDDNRV